MIQKAICAAVIAASYLVICTCICAQVPNGTLTFGAAADGTTATAANTGFGGVRVGTGGGGFTLQNPGESIGSGAELKGVAPTSGSINSVGVTSAEYGTAGQVYTVQFEAYLSGGSSGTWYFFAGNGASFGTAQSSGFTGTEVFTGVRFLFGSNGAISIGSRGGSLWSNLAIQPMTQYNAYKITVVGNNSTSTVNYGVGQSVAPNTSDIWVGTTLAADNVQKAQLPNATSINAFRFYGENSAGNVATIALDNILWWNSAVQPVAGSPGTLQFSSATYSGSESGGSIALTVTRTGGSSGSVGAQISETDGTATGGASLCSMAGEDYTKGTYAVSFADGETSKSVSIPVCGDAVDESDETFAASLGSVSGGATPGTQSSTTVTILDDDTAGVTMTQSGGSTDVTEGGATDSYTVVLNSQPTANVTVSLSPDSQLNVSPGQLTFTAANWNTSQTVTVTAYDDNIYEGTHTGTIQHTVSSSDAAYNGMSVGSVTATITDNDTISTWTVTKTADTNDGICDADCSLREAIAAAVAGNTITFSPLFNSAQTITTGSELLISSKDLNIVGPGANLLKLDGGPLLHRIFSIANSTVTISGMSMTGGDGNGSFNGGSGGAVYVLNGNVTLDRVHIYGNTATLTGGGVYFSGGAHTVTNSTLSSNTAGSGCGGVVADNTATSVSITNSTVSGNSGGGAAGGVCVFNGAMTILNSTITGNSSSEAGGVFSLGTMNIGSTIVAGNNGAQYPDVGLVGSVSSLGFNLIGDNPGDATNTRSPVTYLTTDILDTDPQLEALDYWGGTVPTHALKRSPASPAQDKGFAFSLTKDQNGQSRTIDDPAVANAAGGDGTDIGATEGLAPTSVDTSVSGSVRTAGGRGIANATVTIEGGGLASPVTVVTSSFGKFRFDNIPAGQTYIVTVRAKRFAFDSPSRAISVTDELAGVDFVAR